LIDLTTQGDLYEIIVHQTQIKHDLIEEFINENILTNNLNFGIINKNGELEKGQGIGIEKEIWALFFEEFYESCCCGASEKVPLLRHDMQVYEWKAIGRIICYALKCGYFPVKLSYAFMKATFMCEESVNNDDLVSSFLRYVSSEDKETIERNLKQFEEENPDELLDVLSSYQCYSKPTKDKT